VSKNNEGQNASMNKV